ncbi:MAG TPA: hypothetical protein VHX88_14585 [Solirubrobacteraceae bacterium]|jgi:hypothetical protein|nr:hypothetical protein [Solirubrobacteraceae bacterium]
MTAGLPRDEAQEALNALRDRVRDAQQAAERLAGMASETPPNGWEAEESSAATAELQSLVDLLDTLRRMLPEDLRAQLADLVRQLLLVLRAIIDWLVGRIERDHRGQEVAVEDIPIG